jgi:hypothetical protein
MSWQIWGFGFVVMRVVLFSVGFLGGSFECVRVATHRRRQLLPHNTQHTIPQQTTHLLRKGRLALRPRLHAQLVHAAANFHSDERGRGRATAASSAIAAGERRAPVAVVLAAEAAARLLVAAGRLQLPAREAVRVDGPRARAGLGERAVGFQAHPAAALSFAGARRAGGVVHHVLHAQPPARRIERPCRSNILIDNGRACVHHGFGGRRSSENLCPRRV